MLAYVTHLAIRPVCLACTQTGMQTRHMHDHAALTWACACMQVKKLIKTGNPGLLPCSHKSLRGEGCKVTSTHVRAMTMRPLARVACVHGIRGVRLRCLRACVCVWLFEMLLTRTFRNNTQQFKIASKSGAAIDFTLAFGMKMVIIRTRAQASRPCECKRTRPVPCSVLCAQKPGRMLTRMLGVSSVPALT